MITIEGKYTAAKIFTDDAEEYALAQVRMICDSPAAAGSAVRVMPDVHPGKIGPIGLTMTVKDIVMPGIVGIDIGCGVSMARLGAKKIEYQKLDAVIRERIPAGFKIRNDPHRFSGDFPFEELRCFRHINAERARHSLGTLGGGNHFIEIDRGPDGELYAVVHSGSRHLGKEVAEFYMKQGQALLKAQGLDVPYELTCLTDELLEDYLHDQVIVQQFAAESRAAILDDLDRGMKWKAEPAISCVHNYIETDGSGGMLRKGAISAKAGETVMIPVNMRDGMILGAGKGNPDWNFSAPHGSGRLLRRTDVRSRYTVSAYKKEMQGIYSACIGRDTLDEAPFAYRGMEEIAGLIADTADIQKILKPVYNYKAGGD